MGQDAAAAAVNVGCGRAHIRALHNATDKSKTLNNCLLE